MDALDASSAVPQANPTPAQTRVGFRVHPELPLLVLPAGVASQLELAPVVAPVPNVKRWLRGVINLRGNFVAVFDIGHSRGLAPLSGRLQVLVINPGPQAIGVTCVDNPQLVQVTQAEPVAADSPLAELSSRRFASAQGDVYEFDVHAWLRRVGKHVIGRQEAA